MKIFFRTFLAAALFFFPLVSFLKSPLSFADGAYMYSDDQQQNDEETEYLDENGNPIKQYEYEEELRKQAEALQKNATVPFGYANNNFGSAKPKMLEVKTINSQFSGAKENTAQAASEKTSGSGLFDSSAEKEKKAPAASAAKTVPAKPRVLVS